MEQGYSQREAAKISGVAQTKLSRLKKSGAIVPDLPDGKYSATLIDKIRAEYGKPVTADDSPVDAQEAAQAPEMPADEQTPAADEIANVVPVIADTPAQVADFVSDNQSDDVPVDGEKKLPADVTDENVFDYQENNSEADSKTSAAEIQPVSTAENQKSSDSGVDERLAALIRADITDSHRHLFDDLFPLNGIVPYRELRGIEQETFQHFNAGYLPKWRHPKSPNTMPTARFIFPLGSNDDPPAYNPVLTPSERERLKSSKLWEAQKSLTVGCKEGFCKLLFHPSGLRESIVVVTEGEFDTMSLWQCVRKSKNSLDTQHFGGVDFVALGGAGISTDLIRRLSAMECKPKIIILFDKDKDEKGNDGAGIIKGRKLARILHEMRVVCSVQFLDDVLTDDEKKSIGKKIDANAILCAKGDDFLFWRLNRVIKRAVEDFKKLEAEFALLNQHKKEQSATSLPNEVVATTRRKSSTAGGNYSDEAKRATIEKLANDILSTVTAEMLEQKAIIRHSDRGAARPKGYECNFCGSGTKSSKTGALAFTSSTPTLFNCLACGASGNVIQFLSKVWGIDNHGKSYFELIQKIADTFGFSYDLSIFEFTPPQPAQEQWENIFADYVTDSDKPATDNPAVSDFEVTHGKIAPQMWPEIIGAKNFLDGLTTEKITAELAQSSKVKRAVALCQFYDFNAAVADNFCNRLVAAKSTAAAQVADWKNNGGLTAPPDDDVQSLAKFTLSNWKKNVTEVVTQIKCRQKRVARALRRNEISERNQQVQSERDEAARAAAEQQKSRFAELKALPPSPERDAEIVAQICDACDWQRDKDDMPVAIKTTAANANLIFSNDPALDGVIGFDEFQQCDVFLKRPPWRKGVRVGDVFADRDAARIRFYLRETYAEFGDVKTVDEAIITYSDELAFHPVKQYLKSLPKWDGKPRAESIFIDFLGVKDTPYSRELTRKWLLAAVARIFFPGCHFQSAIVLKGNQGIGKSFILERLGGKWYNTISDSVDDSHAVDAIQNTWIGEFKEMKSLRKADLNAIKAFIDTSADNRRPAYGKRTDRFERHIVFAATTNDEHFLKDVTGNRRFWILECGNKRGHYVEGLTDEFISQVWAEVMIWAESLKRFDEQTGEWKCDEKQLELSAEMKEQVEAVAEDFMVDDGLAGEISGYLDQLIPPTVIWELLTQEQRRKFIAEGNLYVGGGLMELEARIKNRQYKTKSISLDLSTLRRLLTPNNEGKYFRDCGGVESKGAIVLLGTDFRQHVCAAEVYNEHFPPADKRRMMYRIHEVLANLEGWHLGERIQAGDPVYKDQKKVYYRDKNPADTDNTAGTPADDERADAQIEPPVVKSKLDEFVSEPFFDDLPF